MFTLTPAAAQQIIAAAAAYPNDDEDMPCLRVAAKIEDGDIVYGMGFDEEREQDTVVESCGVTVLISPLSRDLLADATLDFVELRPGEFQFVFLHGETAPGAEGGCASRSSGCGGCGGGTAGGCG
ncbi:iron-sulfur cluster assembly accessory protein [Sulfuricystis multivorans]|uniref:iron-sulfur cluster assembly accessory protein n=1 Tax=Sulfuricystis multivorans TaxID=2211108 RepID=UPI000F837E26|nr:iron-sulfur cluster assembly accessory protein [Sulfuricystis multivorans]